MKDVIVIWERSMERGWMGGRESLYSSPYVDDFNGVRRIVPCTNLNTIEILNLEISCDLCTKMISFR